jgi:antitoxin ParD1/3/4
LKDDTKYWYHGFMTISLTPELDDFVERQVKSGRYKSNSEVIRAGLRALADQDLRVWLQEGLSGLEAGKKVEARTVVRRLRERLKQPVS